MQELANHLIAIRGYEALLADIRLDRVAPRARRDIATATYTGIAGVPEVKYGLFRRDGQSGGKVAAPKATS